MSVQLKLTQYQCEVLEKVLDDRLEGDLGETGPFWSELETLHDLIMALLKPT